MIRITRIRDDWAQSLCDRHGTTSQAAYNAMIAKAEGAVAASKTVSIGPIEGYFLPFKLTIVTFEVTFCPFSIPPTMMSSRLPMARTGLSMMGCGVFSSIVSQSPCLGSNAKVTGAGSLGFPS